MPLTDAKLRVIAGKDYDGPPEIADRDGLSIRVSPRGVISFQRRFRWQGKPARVKFGNYPELSLSDARKANDRAKESAKKGIDPRFEERAGGRQVDMGPVTVRKALDYWLTNYADLNMKSAQKARRMFENHVYPFMGDVPIEQTETRHWVAMFKQVTDKHKTKVKTEPKHSPVQAGILLAKAKQALRYCRVHKFATCRAIDDLRVADVGKKDKIGERRLYAHELAKLWRYLHGQNALGDRNRLATILILLFGCRTVELRTSLKKDWDFKNKVWTAEDTKAGHTVRRPIPDPFVPYLQKLITFFPDSAYLLPVEPAYNKGIDKPVSGQSLTNMSGIVCRELGFEKFGLHDFRRTLDTSLSAMRIPPYIIEKMLGHKLTGVMAVYNKHDYIEEQEHAYLTWFDYLQNNAYHSNVAQLRQPAATK
jgi:integrase